MKRHYTDKEIGALIQRATELQEDAKASSERSLSFEDIEHIAAEIGIDPTYLRNAAIELESGIDTHKPFSLTGAPFKIDQKRVAEGTVTEEQWEYLVQEMRRSMGGIGQSSAVGQTKEWSRTIEEFEHTHVTLSPRGGQTTIHVQKDYRGGALIGYILSVVFSVTLAGIFFDGSGVSDTMLTLIVCMTALTALVAMRVALGRWATHQRQKVQDLLDRLDDAIVPQKAIEEPGEQPLVDLPHLPEDEASELDFAALSQRIKT